MNAGKAKGSRARVAEALKAAGIAPCIVEVGAARTAAEAAAAVGCEIDQIVKSIILAGKASGRLCLFLAAGGNRVDTEAAAALAGEALARADPETVRRQTGFAIGGVAPVGHLHPLPAWLDPRLLDFPQVWAAAGTPNHVFAIRPESLMRITGATRADFAARI